ncbi:single-stranded DNA-binding protein [bacterium]|nr:single-stranded DNA-binding protein [bacterium]
MASLNKIMLIGRLTRDPELRYTQQGTAVANFSLAVDRTFKNQAGETQTDFIKVVVWRKLAETIGKYLVKGSLVYVEGSLQLNKYEDSNNIKRTSAEVMANTIQFLDKKSKTSPESSKTAPSEFDHMPVDDFTTDDIPF